MRVAIVHDWLTVVGGAERVLRELLTLYPDAELFSVVDFMTERDRATIHGRRAHTTFIQQLPWAQKRYRSYLPLMPIAIEQLDLSAYDLILSSSYAVAKGILAGPDQAHISYVHSPMRYAWDLQNHYLRESGLEKGIRSTVIRIILHYMRLWDFRTGAAPDLLIANSQFVRRRIRKTYGRDAVVVHPPVDITRFSLTDQKADFYLTASRMVPYKRVPLIVEAFRKMPDKRLVVIGDGPELPLVQSLASNNVEILGYQDDETLANYLRRARAFVFAAEEDFGIAPLEAQACGTPVIAFGKGGALETVLVGTDNGGDTGVYFFLQEPDAIVKAVTAFESTCLTQTACRSHAERFSAELFRRNIQDLIASTLEDLHKTPPTNRLRP